MENPKSLFNSRVKSWFFGRQWFLLSLIFAIYLMTNYTVNAQVYQGVVPVQAPTGGFGVDGDAYADTPDTGVGDWFDDNAGAGGGAIMGSDGLPLDPSMTTFHKDGVKGENGGDLTAFTGSNTIDDDPNTYTWGPGSTPAKTEVQNSGVHFTYGEPNITGTNGADTFIGNPDDLWCLFAADRKSINGSSYIDFEFLQNTLTMVEDGTFSTMGSDMGRTVNDLLVTVELTQEGGVGDVVLHRWESDGGTGYIYVEQHITTYPNTVFATNNNDKILKFFIC